MHPAEHRILRELHAFLHQLERHWSALGPRLGGMEGELLLAGAGEAAEVRGELDAAAQRRGLAAGTAASSAGWLISARPPAPDVALERNQALRWAVHDADHCTLGLRYAARLAAARSDDALRALLDGWAERLEARERLVREAAVALGERPGEAVRPADPTRAGRAGHGLATTLGAVGEWVDRRIHRGG